MCEWLTKEPQPSARALVRDGYELSERSVGGKAIRSVGARSVACHEFTTALVDEIRKLRTLPKPLRAACVSARQME